MCDYSLPAWKIKQLKKFHKTLKQKHEAYRINAVILLGTGYTGRESFLTNEPEQKLSQYLEENLYQRSQDIQRYIEKKYKVKYSRSGLTDLLH